MNKLIYLRNVSTLQLDKDRCTGCGTCLMVCPHEVLARHNGMVKIKDRDACMECGACAMNCPADALSVQPGVGCAAAVIRQALGRGSSECCCVIEAAPAGGNSARSPDCRTDPGCC